MNDDELTKGLLGCVGVIALYVAIVVAAALINGWALSLIWGWFIVPVFTLPPLTVVQAIGVGLVIGLLTSHYTPTPKDDGYGKWVKVGGAVIYSLGYPVVIVVMAYIVRGFL